MMLAETGTRLSPMSSSSSASSRGSEPPSSTPVSTRVVLRNLYLSHLLSTWSNRVSEFSAVLFLAIIFPSTLLYASAYALCRNVAVVAAGAQIGAYLDGADRLVSVRRSIVWARAAAVASCALLLLLLSSRSGLQNDEMVTTWRFWALFVALIALASVEKVAATVNTIAVERDWIVVVAAAIDVDQARLNAAMRTIDLLCKLLAPVAISLAQAYDTKLAIWSVLGLELRLGCG